MRNNLCSDDPPGRHIWGCTFVKFDEHLGPKVECSDPANLFESQEAGERPQNNQLKFSSLSNYFLPESQLNSNVITLRLGDFRMVGVPISVNGQNYPRNAFQFSICLIVGAAAPQDVTRELCILIASFCRTIEISCLYFSNEANVNKIRKRLRVMRHQLNYSPCVRLYFTESFTLSFILPQDDENEKNMYSLTPNVASIPHINNTTTATTDRIILLPSTVLLPLVNLSLSVWLDPLLAASSLLRSSLKRRRRNSKRRKHHRRHHLYDQIIVSDSVPLSLLDKDAPLLPLQYDYCLTQISLLVDGLRTIKAIASTAGLPMEAVTACAYLLMRQKLVTPIDIFHIKNSYRPTPFFASAFEDPSIALEAVHYVTGGLSQLPSDYFGCASSTDSSRSAGCGLESRESASALLRDIPLPPIDVVIRLYSYMQDNPACVQSPPFPTSWSSSIHLSSPSGPSGEERHRSGPHRKDTDYIATEENSMLENFYYEHQTTLEFYGISLVHLVAFGLKNGFLRRVHEYPIFLGRPNIRSVQTDDGQGPEDTEGHIDGKMGSAECTKSDSNGYCEDHFRVVNGKGSLATADYMECSFSGVCSSRSGDEFRRKTSERQNSDDKGFEEKDSTLHHKNDISVAKFSTALLNIANGEVHLDEIMTRYDASREEILAGLALTAEHFGRSLVWLRR